MVAWQQATPLSFLKGDVNMKRYKTKRFVPYSMRGKPLDVTRYKPHNLARLDILDAKRRDLYFLLEARAEKW